MIVDVKKAYNRDGKLLNEDDMFCPLKDEYFNAHRKPRWKEFIQFGDDFGFDVRYKDSNGRYIEKIVLPIGKKVVRYGNDIGSFTTDENTDYTLLSLPYTEQSLPYHEYIVTGECEVLCYVDKGIVAPGFDSEGGAIQYRHYMTIYDSMVRGILKEDYTWLKQMD